MKEELWFSEVFQEDSGIVLRIKNVLESVQSPYQQITVFDTYKYGKLLTLDGAVMTTEVDEFFYHEMLVHPAMGVVPKIDKIVIIGGGDGGTLREVTRYKEVKEAYLIEIDKMVTDVCRRHFPQFEAGFQDKRSILKFMDGFEFLKQANGQFDLILVDSTDPVGPAQKLFSEEFFELLASNTTTFVTQFESPMHWEETEREAYNAVKKYFKYVHVYLGPVPTYPSGLWSFLYASNTSDLKDRIREIPEGLKFYNALIHNSILGLPEFAKRKLTGQ